MKFVTDPLGKFEGASDGRIMGALGMLPLWCLEAVIGGKDIKDHLDQRYGFGLYELTGGETDEDGTFKYPGDPDMHPLAELVSGKNRVLFYQHAIIDVNGFRTRMD